MDPERFKLLDLRQGGDTRLDHPEAFLGGHLLDEGKGLLVRGLPGVHVPAHRADDLGAGLQGPLKIRLVEDLHHHIQTLAHREGLQGLQAFRFEERRHQKDGIRAEDLAFLDLVLLENEIAAKQRHLHGIPGIRQMLVLSEIEEAIRSHGNGPSPVLDQALRMGARPIALPHLAAERIAARHLADDGNARLGELFLERVVSAMRILHHRWAFLLLDLDVQRLEYLDFFQHLGSSDAPGYHGR
ncbi:MAG: hypothetical protein BWY56_01470 [Acidobacteria bacterium ADurb.Bin340]|nr:MAG: hypothetical protein BWY56_01470 [Acidobacteria bacterium ADurb.Bin340]